ncbi:hypothetical protein B9G55_11655 [Saccharibacillus sp. O16]|nr:hypothetical protein B9G55_11655 [Saccharibacillus sp. O16]
MNTIIFTYIVLIKNIGGNNMSEKLVTPKFYKSEKVVKPVICKRANCSGGGSSTTMYIKEENLVSKKVAV